MFQNVKEIVIYKIKRFAPPISTIPFYSIFFSTIFFNFPNPCTISLNLNHSYYLKISKVKPFLHHFSTICLYNPFLPSHSILILYFFNYSIPFYFFSNYSIPFHFFSTIFFNFSNLYRISLNLNHSYYLEISKVKPFLHHFSKGEYYN